MSISMKERQRMQLLHFDYNRYGTDSENDTNDIKTPNSKSENESFTFSFSNINVILNNVSSRDVSTGNKTTICKPILMNVSGSIKNGEILGIVGASGGGKTTLLSVISGRMYSISSLTNNCDISGNIYWNTQKLDANNKSDLLVLSNHSAFVMQEDIFQPTIKVKEAIQFSAHLRTENDTTEMIKKSIDEIIDELELNICQHTIIGGKTHRGVSGGEKKRTSIGIELICNPKFIILDEPTTGLDSVNALNIMQKLKYLTEKKNKTIIASIHQPSSSIIDLLDKIMVLSKGNVVYCGYIGNGEFIEYLTNGLGLEVPEYINIIEFFLSKIRKDPDYYIKQWSESGLADNIPKNKSDDDDDSDSDRFWHYKPYHANIYKQFRWLLWRELKTTLRDPALYRMRALLSIFLALLLCIFYYRVKNDCDEVRDRYGFTYLCTAMTCLLGMAYNILAFPLSKNVLEKERKSCQMYSTSIWILIKTIIILPQICFMSLIITLITNLIIGLNSRIYIQFYVIAITGMAADSIGFFVGCISSSMETASQIIPFIILPLMLFSNFYVNIESMLGFLQFIKYLSPWFLGTNEFATEEFVNGPLQKCCTFRPGECVDETGGWILENLFNIDPNEREWYIWILLANFVGWRLIGSLLLIYRNGF